MKLILLALAASLFTLVLMVQARGEPGDVEPAASHGSSTNPMAATAGTPTRKDMTIWNARRKMHAVRQDD